MSDQRVALSPTTFSSNLIIYTSGRTNYTRAPADTCEIFRSRVGFSTRATPHCDSTVYLSVLFAIVARTNDAKSPSIRPRVCAVCRCDRARIHRPACVCLSARTVYIRLLKVRRLWLADQPCLTRHEHGSRQIGYRHTSECITAE